jgi:type IV secretory pathway VirB10-like protein
VWFFAGIGVLAVIVVVVVVTVKLVAPPQATSPASAPVATQPAPVTMKPEPAPPAPVEAAKPEPAPPAPVEAAKPAPAPAPPVEAAKPAPAPSTTTAMLAIEKTPITTDQRGTIVDIGRAGAAVKRDGAVGHVRLYSPNFEAAAAKLAALQKKYGTSEEYADFIGEVKPIASEAAGTLTSVKVKAGDEVKPNQVIGELAIARLTVPVEAVDGTGKKCTAELPAKKTVKGTLLSGGSTERTLELDAVPKDLAAGELGDVKIHCP